MDSKLLRLSFPTVTQPGGASTVEYMTFPWQKTDSPGEESKYAVFLKPLFRTNTLKRPLRFHWPKPKISEVRIYTLQSRGSGSDMLRMSVYNLTEKETAINGCKEDKIDYSHLLTI